MAKLDRPVRAAAMNHLSTAITFEVSLALATFSFAEPLLDRALLQDPEAPELTQQAPAMFHVRFETTRGDIVIEVQRDWSPDGADRFYNLVHGGYFDGCKFFRVRK